MNAVFVPLFADDTKIAKAMKSEHDAAIDAAIMQQTIIYLEKWALLTRGNPKLTQTHAKCYACHEALTTKFKRI